MRALLCLMLMLMLLCSFHFVAAQSEVIVRPTEIDDVLVNPGIGFMTFQRFNGDTLNEGLGWTEGFPIEYQDWDGNLENEGYPATSMAYFRVYWKFIEPKNKQYRWDLIDRALDTAEQRGQTLLLRIAPYGTGEERDVPDWYRTLVGPESGLPEDKWQTDPEDPRYLEHFGGLIRALGNRYDGHPNLESVDLSIVGAWGEGAGSEMLTRATREGLVDAYLDSFKTTPLVMLLTDEKTNKYGLSRQSVGWRVDCLGDMGGFNPNWSHMEDLYPQTIINFGMKEAWKEAPVSLEICWVLGKWKNEGWDVDHIIDESLKWHISSFNAKSSPVPEEWEPTIDRWLKRMGYRFVLRRFTYPEEVEPSGRLRFTSWWDNKGVAPCYKPFRLALRLSGPISHEVFLTEADITVWLPGDNVFDSSVFLPLEMEAGSYSLDLAIVDENLEPKVRLAIEGRLEDGWYRLGEIGVVPRSWKTNGQ
ncbi:MAG: DUF4832 domain-containing protein [Acidobacteriota bacterium]|nr:MAG: DUF4832 domain-containing protein [Acidobacteriota bacterium]